jgi:ribonuclease P protein component
MKFTNSLTENREFKRLYLKGKCEADSLLAIYVRKNNLGNNRLGITVNAKHGSAVKRNRVRRRIKEAYRLNEQLLKKGFDIVIVARVKAGFAPFDRLISSFLYLSAKTGIKE